jgi:hypothetical protein
VIAATVVGAAVMSAVALLFVERADVTLRVTDIERGRVVWSRNVGAGQRFEIRYIHSVERTPVIEEYGAQPDGLWFESMRFYSQGAGLPTEGYVREGNAFVLRARRKVGVLSVRVSSIARHELAIGEERIDLVALAREGAALAIDSRPGPLRLRRPRP